MATAANPVISAETPAPLFPVVAAGGLLKALSLLALLLASVTPVKAQTTAVSGTFKTPDGVNDNGTTLSVNRDIRSSGPNPYFDIRAFGASTSTSTATGCAIKSSSTALTCATNPDFKDASQIPGSIYGNGIVVAGAGALPILAIPGTPTVTPNLLNGATTYTYSVVAEDYAGGITAISGTGTTTTGPTALGETVATVTKASRVSGTTTYTTSAAHNLSLGQSVLLCKFGGAASCATLNFDGFNGAKTVVATPTSTTFTVSDGNGASDATEVATTEVHVQACNTLTFAPASFSGTGTLRYWIYRNGTIAGVAVGLDPYWVDCGGGIPSRPAYVPTTPPRAATPGYLSARVVLGGGTTTMTLNVAAGTTVSGVTAAHDNSIAVLAAADTAAAGQGGGVVYIPSVANSGGKPVSWPFAALTNFNATNQTNSNVATVLVDGYLAVNQPWVLRTNIKIEGQTKRNSSFMYQGGALMSGGSQPMVYINTRSSITLRNLFIQPFGPQSSGLFVDTDSAGNGSVGIVVENVAVGATASGGTERPIVLKGGFDYFFKWLTCNISTANLPKPCLEMTNSSKATFNGQTQVPGNVRIENSFFVTSGISYNTAPNSSFGGGVSFYFTDILTEVLMTPFLRVGPGPNSTGGFVLRYINMSDVYSASGTPLIDASGSGAKDFTVIGGATSGSPVLIGAGTLATQNPPSRNLGDRGGFHITPTDTRVVSQPLSASAGGRLTYAMSVPGPLTSCVISKGGAVPIGTLIYQVSAVDADSNETTLSQSVSVTTSSGQQTVTCTLPAKPVGAAGFDVYRTGARVLGNSCTSPQFTGTTYVDTGGICGQSAQSFNTAGSAFLASTGLAAGTYRTVGANGFAVTRTNTATAARRQTEPDATGTYLLDTTLESTTSMVSAVYDNFNRANNPVTTGAPVTWTVSSGTVNVSSNAVGGATGAAQNIAVVVSPVFSSDQFSEATFTVAGAQAMNVVVRGSSVAASDYECQISTRGHAIAKLVAGSFTSLVSDANPSSVGDVVRCEVQGTTLRYYLNGVQILTTTDSTFASGSPGLRFFSNTTTAADNWSGGNLNSIPRLNKENDWLLSQHFIGPVTIGPSAPIAGTLAAATLYTPNLALNGRTLSRAGGNAATVTTQSATLTNGKVVVGDANNNASPAAGSGPLGITYLSQMFIRFALCNNGTAALATDTTAASTVGCFGTTTRVGVWQAKDADVVTFSVPLATDFTGAIDGRLYFNSPDTTGTVIFNVALACVDGSGSTADDPAYNASSAFGTITLAAPANASWVSTVAGITQSGTTTCAAGNWLNGKITRARDTATSRVNVKGLELTVRRAL